MGGRGSSGTVAASLFPEPAAAARFYFCACRVPQATFYIRDFASSHED